MCIVFKKKKSFKDKSCLIRRTLSLVLKSALNGILLTLNTIFKAAFSNI